MKKIMMGVAAWSLLLATGCSNEELVRQTEGQQFVLEVGVGIDSRTYNDEEGHCNWGDNESIYVFSEDGQSDAVLTLIRKNGKTATFAGTVNGNASKLKYTVYPVPNAEGEISMAKVNGKNHNAPMYGTIEGSGAKLEYAGGLVKLDINGAGDGIFKAVGAKNSGANKVTGGHYKFNGATKKLEFVPGNSTVEITDIPSDGIVFLPIATDAAYNSPETVAVTLTTPEGEHITENVAVAKGASTQSEENSFPSVNYDSAQGLVKAEINDLSELEKALKVGGEYELTADITTENILFITKDIEIKGNNHKITSSANRIFRISSDNINVRMNKLNMISTAKQSGMYNDIRGISIDSPKKGIGLALDTCSVDFTDASANDWSYAVNVCEGAEHCGITISGGSYEGANAINIWGKNLGIHIENAILTSLYRPSEEYCGACIRIEEITEYLETYKVTFEGAHAKHISIKEGKYIGRTTASSDNINTRLAIAKAGDNYYYTLDEAAKSGKQISLFNNVVLTKDINITNGILVKSDAIVDLGGKKIVATGAIPFQVNPETSLTLKNGTVNSEQDVIKTLGEECEITIDNNAVLNATGEQATCIWIPAGANKAKVNIKSGTLSSVTTKFATISVNGQLNGVEMKIEGGNIASKSTAVYFPSNGNLTISGGEIVGVLSAVEFRGTGLLTISGGTFMTTAETFQKGANNNGTTISGAAVVVSPHDGRTPNVKITGGSFKVPHDNTSCYAFWEGPVNPDTEVGTVEISGWKTYGLIHSSRLPGICSENCVHE